ncbi:hypothetical protein D3C71_1099750 [compost metagenome]
MGIRHRRFLNADRKAGLVATVSMRALIVEPCSFLALAQKGSRPQDSRVTCRPVPRSRITEARCVGARL